MYRPLLTGRAKAKPRVLKGLSLYCVGARAAHMGIKHTGNVRPVLASFGQPDTNLDTSGKGRLSVETLPPSDSPVGVFVGHFPDYDWRGRGQLTVGDANPGRWFRMV